MDPAAITVGCAIGIPLGALLIATLTFRRSIAGDAQREEREECRKCFEERRSLEAAVARKDRQIFELMLAALGDQAPGGK